MPINWATEAPNWHEEKKVADLWQFAPRRYVDAVPKYDFMRSQIHWPSAPEYEALHAAKRLIDRKRIVLYVEHVEVPVKGANTCARVSKFEDGSYESSIAVRGAEQGCVMGLRWNGVPVWADELQPQTPQHAYVPNPEYRGPGNCCEGCRRERHIHHHHMPDEHRLAVVDRGQVTAVNAPRQAVLSPQGHPPALPAPKPSGFLDFLFRPAGQKVR